MFEYFETAEDVYGYRLGSMLTTEHDWLALIPALIFSIESDEVVDYLEFQAAITRQHIVSLNETFAQLELAPAEYPSPVSKAITKSEVAFIEKCAPPLRESGAIAAALTFTGAIVTDYVVLLSTLPNDADPTVRTTLEEHLAQETAAYEQFQMSLMELMGPVGEAST